jgi:hypothetical protein
MTDFRYIEAEKELTAFDCDYGYCIYSVTAIRRTFLKMQMTVYVKGSRGGAVGTGTALQAKRSLARFPMVSLYIDIILPVAIWLWG